MALCTCKMPYPQLCKKPDIASSTSTIHTVSGRCITDTGRVDSLRIRRNTPSIRDHVSPPTMYRHVQVLIATGTSLTDLAHDFANQGIFQIEHYKSSSAGRGPHFGTPEEHIETLNKAKQVMPILTELPALRRHGGPVLCHPDFHPGNIFVCRKDPTVVDGIVDWQFANILPRFTEVRWPLFLTMGGDAEDGQEDAKCEAQRKHEEAMRIKCYEAALVKSHREPYLDLPEHVAVRRLFTLCPITYQDGILPVRDCLVKLFQYWGRLGLSKNCPYHFSATEIAQHEKQWAEYQEWLKLREQTHDMLKSNDGGWIPPGVDFEETKSKHQMLYEHFIRTKMKYMSKEEARKLWFFRERG